MGWDVGCVGCGVSRLRQCEQGCGVCGDAVTAGDLVALLCGTLLLRWCKQLPHSPTPPHLMAKITPFYLLSGSFSCDLSSALPGRPSRLGAAWVRCPRGGAPLANAAGPPVGWRVSGWFRVLELERKALPHPSQSLPILSCTCVLEARQATVNPPLARI